METKEQLMNAIKEWVKLDNEIRKLHREQEERKIEKKKISLKLIDIMKNNEIDCFDIKDGKICYEKKNIKKPITKKVLFSILTKYYQGDSAKAEQMNQFIIENREQEVKESITRKIKNTNRTDYIPKEGI
jgi:hypothetical protein